ncbi:Titin [Frankliniella fusca]|uniref:Titin n=1 Tax=Frankliniella fusca TaxID=407009 RepID=A0AAE1HL10_9NEOP|nr:Titin [Frankliniella fusca]
MSVPFLCLVWSRACGHNSVVLAVKPQILALSFGDDPINSGDTAAVQCTVVKGDAPIKIEWLFNGEPVVPGRRGTEVTKTGQKISALSVESVQAEHSGEYTCRASNKAGTDTQTVLLNVQVAPQILALSFGDDPINSGDTAAVQCTVVKGDAPISITWYLNGQEVRSGDGIEINKLGAKISVLSLEAAQARHSGEYTCRASNKAGADSQAAVLNVQGTAAGWRAAVP